jgi:hypothetical protein
MLRLGVRCTKGQLHVIIILLLAYAFHMYYRCEDKNSAIEVERDGTIPNTLCLPYDVKH